MWDRLEVPQMMEDPRPIQALLFNDEAGTVISVGRNDVTRIVCYGEPSHYGNVPWFAVYCGEDLCYRIPAGRVEVRYLVREGGDA